MLPFAEATHAELSAFLDALTEEEKAALIPLALASSAQEDDPEGFAAFFELMSGMQLHPEARDKWIPNAYRAHEEGRGCANEAHRESAKTTIFSKYFAAFRIGHEPHKVNGIIRVNDNKAQETAAAIARIIEYDARWKLVFPHIVPDKQTGWGAETGYYVKDDRLSDAEWVRRCDGRPDGPTWVGRGWKNGSNIGSRFNGFIIIDDIHDRENTTSAVEMKAVKDFYKSTLKLCIMKGAWELWNFTPWKKDDLYAHIKATGEYVHTHSPVMYPANPGDPGAQYWPPTPLNRDYPEIGNIPLSGRYWVLTWPEQWNFDRLAQMYRNILDEDGPADFQRMLLLDLKALDGITLKAEWLHQFPAVDINPSWPVLFGVDYASTQDKLKQTSRDYFALAIMRALPGGGLVLVDGFRGHVSKGEALDKVAGFAGLYPTLQQAGVENIGKGEEFYNDLLFTNDISGNMIPLTPIQHGRRSKGDRFENWLAPRFQKARLWISDLETSFLKAFRNEWINYPNVANDDCLDAVYMAAFAGEGFLPVQTSRTREHKRGVASNVYAQAFGKA